MSRVCILLALLWVVPSVALATAPSFVQEAEVSWLTNGGGSPWTLTTSSFTVQSGDVLVVIVVGEDQTGVVLPSVPTNSGTGFTWTRQQVGATSNYTSVAIYTATASTGQSMTVTVDVDEPGSSTLFFGFNVFTFRGSDGIGNSNLANVTNGAPSLSLTTTQANSAIVMVNGDWAAVDGASPTYRTSDAGTFTQMSYARDAAHYTIYGGYYADAGTAAAKTIGISAPGAQTYRVAAVEVKGTAGGGAAETFGFRKRTPQ